MKHIVNMKTQTNRKRSRLMLWALMFGCVCLLSPVSVEAKGKKPPPKKGAKKDPKKGEPKQEIRMVGSIIFPERGDVVRNSSALKLLTPEVLECIKKSITFIRRSQQADGSWGDKQFPKSSGVTALCCFALFAEGSLPRIGPSGKKLDKAVRFLLSCGKEDGLLVAKDTYSYGPIYDHTWATLALLMAYGNAPWYPELRKKISRAVQATLRAQKPDGGWRYSISPLGNSDISVTASVLATLKFAKVSGFAVAEDRIKKAQNFIQRCGKLRRPEDKGTFCYREGGERGGASTTAAGLLGLFSRGLYEHEFVAPCTESISYTYRRAHLEDLTDSPRFRYLHFGCYYSSQAMFMAGDNHWFPWYKKFSAVMQATQTKLGNVADRHNNTVYPTAIAAVILQAPFGYLPQYLR